MGTPRHKRPVAHCRSAYLYVASLALSLILLPAPQAPAEAAAAHGMDMGASGLNLTAPQQQKLAALEASSRTQGEQLIGQIEQLRRKLSALYETYALDTGAAKRLDRDLNRVQGQLLDLHLSQQQQFRAILTADQFARLQASLHQHDSRDDHRHGDGNFRGRRRGDAEPGQGPH